MPLDSILNSIYDAFQREAQDARIILLHPASRYRTVLVSRLLSDPAIQTFYYAIGTDDVDIKSFVAGLTHDMAEQVPTFGANTNMISLDRLDDLTLLLEAFSADLNQLSDEPFYLILDEFDRAKIGDDLQSFLEGLIDYMPAHCRIVISSRNLPRFPWMSLITQHKAAMLRDDSVVAQDFYENQAKDQARVRLLFFFSLDRPVVTRSEICQAFWPELSTEQAVNVFHVTKRRLHKAIESLGVDVLVHEDGSYRVNPALSIHYDVTDFVSALVEARNATGKKKSAAWQHVIDLYPRPFLQGHSEPWILKRRQEYQAGYLEALGEMADQRIVDGRPESALGLLQLALKENNRRQDLHRRVMSLYSDLGRRSETASHYQKLQEILDENDQTLEPETKALYKELMA